jgi:hypothetical protein
MDAKNFFNGMMLLTIIAILAGSACAATPTAAYGTATTLAQRLAPTNMVLDYDLTRVDANLKAGDSGLLWAPRPRRTSW